MNTAIPFKTFYDTSLLPTLTTLERERKKLVNTLLLYIAVSLTIAIPLYFVVMFLAVIPPVVAGIVYFVKYGNTIKEKKHHFKHEVIGKMIGFLDTNLTYEPAGCIDSGIYRKSKLFLADFNKYKGDDLVRGTIGKTAVNFCELHTELEKIKVDSKGNRTKSVQTVFRGIFFSADFNKKFVGETFVLPDAAERLLGSFGAMLQKMNMGRPQLIKLEDVAFEKAFVVYGTDQVEARYILSTALMQRLMAFRDKTHKAISVSFIDSQIYIAIPISGNMFEAPLFSSMVNYDRMAEYHRYLELCVSIVETLDLNTRIWTKA